MLFNDNLKFKGFEIVIGELHLFLNIYTEHNYLFVYQYICMF
jgi:hypothetical protein